MFPILEVAKSWLTACLISSVVKEINKINQLELDLGISGASWHDEYKDSAYVFVGGLHFDLTEGDVITIFSQYVSSCSKAHGILTVPQIWGGNGSQHAPR